MDIKKALEDGKTICVNYTWCFTGKSMACFSEFDCCSSTYDTIEEAVEMIKYYSDGNKNKLEIY